MCLFMLVKSVPMHTTSSTVPRVFIMGDRVSSTVHNWALPQQESKHSTQMCEHTTPHVHVCADEGAMGATKIVSSHCSLQRNAFTHTCTRAASHTVCIHSCVRACARVCELNLVGELAER